MKRVIASALCVIFPLFLFAGDNAYKITYDGGSIPATKAGTAMKLYIDSNQLRLVSNKTDVITIPASAVTEISYGQDVHRRVGAAIGLAVVSFGTHGVDQIEEALYRVDVGQRGPKGWPGYAVR